MTKYSFQPNMALALNIPHLSPVLSNQLPINEMQSGGLLLADIASPKAQKCKTNKKSLENLISQPQDENPFL